MKRFINVPGELEEQTEIHHYDFNDMRDIVKEHNPDRVLVDVRETSEFEEVRIPGSINVPYWTHPEAFTLDADTFQKEFHIQKPEFDKELIFFCGSGKRSAYAQQVAKENGYQHTSLYPGSMKDWISHGGAED
ncbi:hypothetical protein KAFR_0B03330 [Kazachstania africana CBS 2517]|uniref:Rhodanese domain-containing protein n=1 Tax=Kazachstania africana (strain ATCC 22294 / BCRC 22015 / CBS 2517 / CECT 1963 / NBRC 1671 / NRRL Y-8276) TaxID=1071382 RepID=H2AQI0_KAZAF|nr:hypothetical protein KAFR_0B03330 [Kazachstania africana CBS 2517]CCF56630.1 hypothetical protein KAFR_0B03330 [Kazachstania africana CBS 2517]